MHDKKDLDSINDIIPPVDVRSLSFEEQALVEALLTEPNLSVLEDLFYMDYEQIPVTPEEFLNSDYYLGTFANALYPTWKEELTYVLDPANGIVEWIIHGSIGTGKTTAACVAQLYKLYVLTCMKSPQRLFGLAEHLPVYFAFFNVTKEKATESLAGKFNTMMNLSPYFREHLPKNNRKVFLKGAASMFGTGYKEHKSKDDLFELSLPHNLNLLFGARTQHALSLDVFSATLDEMNFRRKRSVKEADDENSAAFLYTQVRTRIESRFQDRGSSIPGVLINISSAKASDSFVELRMKKVLEDRLTDVHISAFALWDVKPGRYSGKTFPVFVGGGIRPSRILEPGEQERDYSKMFPNEQMVNVPIEHRKSFENNLPAAIRDLAGISTISVDKLFKRAEIIEEAIDKDRVNPIYPEVLEIGVLNDLEIQSFYDLDITSRFDNVQRTLKDYPGVQRFIHIDLAKNSDYAGICSLCIPKYWEIKTVDENKNKTVQVLPYVYVDFAVGIRAPKNDEISFEKVRQFVLWLQAAAGYNVGRISYDSWQSVDSTQLLRVAGYDVLTLSVDKTDEPYMELHNAFKEHRINIPPHGLLTQELKDLIYDISYAKPKVDHPSDSSKDISDALAGAHWNAISFCLKFGFSTVGATKLQEKVLGSQLTKQADKKYLAAKKESKELGMKGVVHLEAAGWDGKGGR